VYLVNDSGHEAELFAIDTAGNDRGTWRVANATNTDWEAATRSPCPAPEGRDCLLIADTGDNDERRRTVTLYRVPEPDTASAGFTGTLTAERLDLGLEGGPRDVEAMYAGPQGDVFLVTKRRQRRADGALRQALVLLVKAGAWSGAHAVARIVDSLPIVPGSAPGRSITDAAIAPDWRHVAVRTYAEVYVFAADTATGAIRTSVAPARCSVDGIERGYGEGVAWLDNRRLLLTQEGRDAPMHVLGCRMPEVAR
jgi:hypothetical protein